MRVPDAGAGGVLLLWKAVLLWEITRSTSTTALCPFRPAATAIDLPVLRCLFLTFFSPPICYSQSQKQDTAPAEPSL